MVQIFWRAVQQCILRALDFCQLYDTLIPHDYLQQLESYKQPKYLIKGIVKELVISANDGILCRHLKVMF